MLLECCTRSTLLTHNKLHPCWALCSNVSSFPCAIGTCFSLSGFRASSMSNNFHSNALICSSSASITPCNCFRTSNWWSWEKADSALTSPNRRNSSIWRYRWAIIHSWSPCLATIYATCLWMSVLSEPISLRQYLLFHTLPATLTQLAASLLGKLLY